MFNKLNKDGFTLIELLAVIVILAIIALIAMPIVLNVIGNVEKEAYKNSSLRVLRAAEIFEAENEFSPIDENGINVSELKLDNNNFTGGKVIKNSKGKLELVNLTNGIYCANGTKDKLVVVKGNCGGSDSDTIPPQITLNGDSIIIIQYGETYIEQGATAVDNIDGDITDKIVITGEVDSNIPGEYSIIYTVSDKAGNTASATRSVHVVIPETCFTFDSSTGTINDYSTNSECPKYVVIPSTIGGVGVTSIGYKAFYNKGLTTVIIPNNVTSIDDLAFYNNQLSSVIIPNSVQRIGSSSFASNKLTSVTISGSVTSISDYAFENNKLISVTIPNSVTSIGKYAFRNNQLTSVTIPNSVLSIGIEAFYKNKITNVIIPNSVTDIAKSAFNDNQLPDDQAIIYARKSNGEIDYTKIVSYGGKKRDNVVIPNGVTTIGEGAFAYNQLTSVTIPNSVTRIEYNAFYDNQLSNLNIPNSVTYIGESAFCRNVLTSVTIPNSVTIIGPSAFANNQLTSVTIPGSVNEISKRAFDYNQLTSVIIMEGVKIIGVEAFSNNRIVNVTIPNTVTTIYGGAFAYNNLTSVTIPGSVTFMDGMIFYYNTGLKTIINRTGKKFNWGTVIVGSHNSDNYFVIGTVYANFNGYYLKVDIVSE